MSGEERSCRRRDHRVHSTQKLRSVRTGTSSTPARGRPVLPLQSPRAAIYAARPLIPDTTRSPMSTETRPPGEGGLPGEPFLDLASLDAEALRGYLRILIPLALEQLQEGFGLRRLRVRDESEAEAILWSACT